MRAIVAGLPLLVLLVAACSAPEDPGDLTGGTTEGLARRASCAITRTEALAEASPARANALQRGLRWLDAHVPYSQSASHEGYRTDCSGFVSMCWQLGTSTNTASMASGAYNTRLASYGELLPADALLRNGHVALFVGWNDAGHTSACLLEEGSRATGTQMRAQSVASLEAQGFAPIRAKALGGSAGAGAPSNASAPTGAEAPPADAPTPSGAGTPQAPAASDTGDTSCWSRTLGGYAAELSCVHSTYDDADEQCHDGLWYRGVSGGRGPFGACAGGGS